MNTKQICYCISLFSVFFFTKYKTEKQFIYLALTTGDTNNVWPQKREGVEDPTVPLGEVTLHSTLTSSCGSEPGVSSPHPVTPGFQLVH